MEEKGKKAPAKSRSAKAAANPSAEAQSPSELTPKTKKPAAKAKKAEATEVAPAKKPAAKAKKAEAAEVAPAKKPTAKAKKAEATEVAPAKKPAAKAKKAEATEVAPAKKPAAKAKKAEAAEVAPAKKPAAKATAKATTTPAVSKPAAKAKKAEAAEVAPAKKPAAKAKKAEGEAAEVAPAKKPAAKAKKAEGEAAEVAPAKKPAAKAKKPASKAEAIAPATTETEAGAKVRTKPRRRELKRDGLWVPKNERGKHGKQRRAERQAKLEARKQAEAEQRAKLEVKAERRAQVAKAAEEAKAQAEQRGKSAPQLLPGKASKSKQKDEKPAAFDEFAPRQNPKALAKAERREAREEKAEREYNQSQGLFEEPVRLNRYVALSGVCSRRDADALIQSGKVKVNGKVVREMGHKVHPAKDKVTYNDQDLRIKVFVYLLMNKPKNRISTTEDDLGRDTVMEIAERYTKARVYPVGRLDRNTTGLLLLTNDGDLTQKLTHPSSKVAKYYNVRTDRDVTDADIMALRRGFELEDGFIKADKAERISAEALNEIGIEIHSGANHIVKRMLGHLGYEVTTLDRMKLGPLTKKGLPRGKCRLLSDREVGFLKML